MKHYLIAAVIINSLLILIGLILIYVFFGDINYLLTIHFDSYRGIDFWGNKWDVFGIMIAATAISAINFLLLKAFYNRERFVSYLLGFFTIFFLILILISLAVIISVN